MEDNEFEEVTIISHTDRPQRVFSEKSIEKLKDQVSLEIVKEINGTEDKTYSDDPRLAPGLRELEKLKQDHFGEGEGKIPHGKDIYFISRVAGESGQYLLGTKSAHALLSNNQHSKIVKGQYAVHYVVEWGNQFFVFCFKEDLLVFDIQGNVLAVLKCQPIVLASRLVMTTQYHLYYWTEVGSGAASGNGICKLDKELNEVIIRHENIRDFFVCPKTETITTLERLKDNTFILRTDQMVTKLAISAGSGILKKMYSDHFLVASHLVSEKQLDLHFVEVKTHRDHHSIKVRANYTKHLDIRLLAPRQGINCFLVAMSDHLELFCEYRLKLYHLKTLKCKESITTYSHQMHDLWVVANTFGVILSVRVDFSKCPALQL